MTLGILVSTDRHLRHIRGIVKSALHKGHTVKIFAMDDGVKLLGNEGFNSLSDLDDVSMSYCGHSATSLGLSFEGLSERITAGSQLNNIMMVQRSERVLSF